MKTAMGLFGGGFMDGISQSVVWALFYHEAATIRFGRASGMYWWYCAGDCEVSRWVSLTLPGSRGITSRGIASRVVRRTNYVV